ncbi:MAG: imidazole glycerol phosphate synthase subunit HisF [Candidatus Micrarchaeota archaeon]|nr:imidazole glycerol phosphate synthase subunit HisF [Candidatus Micrarchaeota archaeon]
MLAKRIIPCLDIKQGRVVKGVKFANLRDAGDPLELAKYYNEQGADEISFLDIMASAESRPIFLDLVERVSKALFIPFSVGGGIRTVDDIRQVLSAGAEKVSIGSAAVKNPVLVREAAEMFGSQAIVLSIDAKKNSSMPSGYELYIKGGREPVGLDALEFAKRMVEAGAGEILLNAMDSDGTKKGYDLTVNRMFSESLNVPIIASGGAGSPEDILKVLTEGKADAALAASIFHYGEYTIGEAKEYLKKNGVVVRE